MPGFLVPSKNLGCVWALKGFIQYRALPPLKKDETSSPLPPKNPTAQSLTCENLFHSMLSRAPVAPIGSALVKDSKETPIPFISIDSLFKKQKGQWLDAYYAPGNP